MASLSSYSAMIPLRSGSKRVPNKNLRIIKGRPLAYYILESVVTSDFFDKTSIFINSSDPIFKELADYFGIQFYRRPNSLSTDQATNDDFLYDFIRNSQSDIIFQFLATSPLISPKTILRFCTQMSQSDLNALISVKNIQIECVHNSKGINFDPTKQTPPSQELVPVQAYACGLMAWKTSSLIENYKKTSVAYHANLENIDFFPLSVIESLDVDTLEDLFIAEAVLEKQHKDMYLSDLNTQAPAYTTEQLTSTHEVYVPEILSKDGVSGFDTSLENSLITNLDTLVQQTEPGLKRLIHTLSNSACLISQQKGEGNRLHYHPDWEEWWYITKGQWDFYIDGITHHVTKGDLICIPRNMIHKITATADGISSRLAVSRQDVIHAYPNQPK